MCTKCDSTGLADSLQQRSHAKTAATSASLTQATNTTYVATGNMRPILIAILLTNCSVPGTKLAGDYGADANVCQYECLVTTGTPVSKPCPYAYSETLFCLNSCPPKPPSGTTECSPAGEDNYCCK